MSMTMGEETIIKCMNCGHLFTPRNPDDFDCCGFCRKFTNKAMARKIRHGQCISVHSYGREIGSGLYELSHFFTDIDWADPARERWIASIGQNVHTGVIHAALDNRFYGNANWKCLFLR